MKKAIIFVTSSVVIGIFLIIVLFLSIVATPKDVFWDHYDNTLSSKYETLINTNSPKIIIVGGSSGAFGLDGNMLAKMTGMNVVNTAIHAGVGALYETEITKANINKGDIVLLGYEWGWITDDNYTNSFGTEHVMTAIDEKIEMYQYVPVEKYKDVLGFLFEFAKKKRTYSGSSGVYSRLAFSSDGNTMKFPRDESPIIEEYAKDPNAYGAINFNNPTISDDTVKYFKKYKKYVESRGASVYWIGCPTYDEAVKCDYSELQQAAKQVEIQIGIKYISEPADYIFPGKYMYNTIYHPNTQGMKYRTELLFKDLKKAGIIK